MNCFTLKQVVLVVIAITLWLKTKVKCACLEHEHHHHHRRQHMRHASVSTPLIHFIHDILHHAVGLSITISYLGVEPILLLLLLLIYEHLITIK